MANPPDLAIRGISPTGIEALFDYFGELRYTELEIGGMAKRALQSQRVASAEAALSAAAAQTPVTFVALTTSTVGKTSIPSWLQRTAHHLLVGVADQD